MTIVAAVQLCSSHIIDENLETAGEFIAKAAMENAKLIVFPEMFAIMGCKPTDKVTAKEIFGSGKIQSFLSENARKHNIWIVGGTIPIVCKNENKIKASSLVFDDKGNCIANYEKIHLFDVTLSDNEVYKESDTTEPGNKIIVVDTPFGRLGLAVCYDIRFPELFRCLLNNGAEIIVLPSAFTVPTGEAHWQLLARSRAVENFCYLVGACQGGTHSSGRKTYGHSLIIDPWGRILSEIPGIGSGIIYADVDIQKLYDYRRSIPIRNHQKIFFDTSLLEQ